MQVILHFIPEGGSPCQMPPLGMGVPLDNTNRAVMLINSTSVSSMKPAAQA